MTPARTASQTVPGAPPRTTLAPTTARDRLRSVQTGQGRSPGCALKTARAGLPTRAPRWPPGSKVESPPGQHQGDQKPPRLPKSR
eukprot:5240468-Pyramimonas_sp.AAC.1